MNKKITAARRLLIGVGYSLLSIAALAQTPPTSELDRVDVAGRNASPMLKVDVHRVCPSIAAQLQESLESAGWQLGAYGQHRVDFKLTGKEISDVRVPHSTWEARRPIKRAVRGLSCDGEQSGTEHYAFILHVIDPDDPRAQGQVAVLDEAGALPVLRLAAR